MASIVILGAGLTGLSAAYHLEKLGCSDFVIYEKNNTAGGLLRSHHEAGFTFDYTGHLLHINDAYFRSFLEDITSFDNFNLVQRNAAVFSHNTLTDYPFQMHLYGLPKEVIYECIIGFTERKKNMKNPRNFYEWVLKYFGTGMGNHFFFPYNSKILSYDIKKVVPSWTGRFVPQTSLEAILTGAFEPKQSAVGYNSSFYYPKKGGIAFLIDALQKKLTTKIVANHEAIHIDTHNKIVHFSNGKTEQYSHLISTAPLNNLLNITTTKSNSSRTNAMSKLICNSVLNFNLGFNCIPSLKNHWIYYPEQKYPFYRLGFWHTIAPSSVPTGMGALYGELSYLSHQTSPQELTTKLALSKKIILNMLNLSSANIVIEKNLTLENAYVIYDTWRENNLIKVLDSLKSDSIYSTGRFGAWKYSSMQEAVLDGKNTAEEIYRFTYKEPVIKTIYNNNSTQTL